MVVKRDKNAEKSLKKKYMAVGLHCGQRGGLVAVLM